MSESTAVGQNVDSGCETTVNTLRNYVEAELWSELGLRAFRKDIAAELRSEPGLDAGAIDVSVRDGKATVTGHIVTLSGEVDWQFQKTMAEHAVRRLSGIIDLVNVITVRSQTAANDAHPTAPKTSLQLRK